VVSFKKEFKKKWIKDKIEKLGYTLEIKCVKFINNVNRIYRI